MSVEPFDWNAVVVGYWNPAILTPRGIAKRLFGLTDGTQIFVEVPLDGLGHAPFRVRHEGTIVTAEQSRLTVTAETPTLPNLERARLMAARAVKALPETPFSAAGFNLRLKLDTPPDQLIRDTSATVDAALSDASFKIKTRSIRRSLEHKNGTLNLDIRQAANLEITIEFNFDLQSTDMNQLCAWLETPNHDIETTLSTILQKLIEQPFQDTWK